MGSLLIKTKQIAKAKLETSRREMDELQQLADAEGILLDPEAPQLHILMQ